MKKKNVLCFQLFRFKFVSNLMIQQIINVINLKIVILTYKYKIKESSSLLRR